MSTNDEILQVATHELIRQLNQVKSSGTPRQELAADIAVGALLALRDTVKRHAYPEIYLHRIVWIRKLVRKTVPKS